MASSMKLFFMQIPQRWIYVVMGFFGLFNGFAMRVCLSITLTEMVVSVNKSKEFLDDSCSSYNEKSPKNVTYSSTAKSETYDWNENQQGLILSSYYWGYVIAELPFGLLAEKFSAKYTFSLGILFTAVLSILSPFAVRSGDFMAFLIIRFLMGCCSSGMYPATNVMLSHWIPMKERSKAGTFLFAGATLGTVFGITLSGLILEHSSIGWPAVFYFFGCISVIWFLLFIIFCYNSPLEHPFISEKESKYLHEELSEHKHKKPHAIPWRHILTSKPIWAIVIANIGFCWGFLTMISDLPKYMNSILKFSVEDNGYLSSLPYLCMWLGSIVTSWIMDWLIVTNRMSLTNVRKFGTTVALIGPALFLIGASYAGCNRITVITLITIGTTLLGSALPSITVNTLDLSPNYAGSIMAFTNTFGSSTGIICPYIVGLLTPHQTLEEWRLIFWIMFVVFVVTGIVFVLCGSGKVQEWNDPEFLKKYNEKRTKPDEKINATSVSRCLR